MSNPALRVNIPLILVLGLWSSPIAAQRQGRPAVYSRPQKAVVLRIEGRVPCPLFLSREEFRSSPRSTTQVAETTGESSTYEGVALVEILHKAGITTGGDAEEGRIFIEGISLTGTHVIFSLAELDPTVKDSNVIVAYTLNGTLLDQKAGLFLVAGSDKTRLRSVDNLIAICVRRLR